VLASKYGLWGSRIRSGDTKASYCWKVLWWVREGVGVSEGRWFEKELITRVGNGEGTSFLNDPF